MFVCQKYSHLSLTLLAMAQSAFSVPQWDSEGLLAWASSSWSDIQKHRSQIRQIIVSSFSQQNQSKKKFFLRLRWYKPLLKFVLFTLMYWITKPGFLEYWWVFSLSGPTVPFIFGRLGIPIFGNKVIPRWLWHTPTNHFFPCFFLRQKMIYLLMDSASLAQSQAHWSKRGLGSTACCSLPRSPSSFLPSLRFLCSFLLLTIPPIHFLTPSSPLQCFSLHLPLRIPFFPRVPNDPLLFKQFSRGYPNPLFSSSVHRPVEKSSKEIATKQVYNLREEFGILFTESCTSFSSSDRKPPWIHIMIQMRQVNCKKATSVFVWNPFFSVMTHCIHRCYMNAFGLT